MPPPDTTEYPAFFSKYIELVSEPDILAAMATQLDEMLVFLRPLPERPAGVCHAPYSWTFKQVVAHVADGERVFGYRALRFGRNDPTPLMGFDETVFALGAESNRLVFADVVDDFEAARRGISGCSVISPKWPGRVPAR